MLVVGLVAASCSDDGGGETAPPPESTVAATSTSAAAADPPGPAPEPSAGACDDLDPTACLLPFPNDRFTRPDESTATGRRVDLPVDATPANADGVHIAVDEWNRNDGFSPSAAPRVVVPGVDPAASGLADQTDIGRSLQSDSALILLDLVTGERVPAWVEVHPDLTTSERRALTIQPAIALTEGHRHAVALRGLLADDGTPIDRPALFADRLASPDSHTAALVEGLEAAGVDIDDVVLGWTFTVSSGESLSGRLRAMWTETRAELGSGAVGFTVDSAEPAGAATVVEGTFEVPKYLAGDGGPGAVFNNDGEPDGIPTRDGTMPVDYTCTVPIGASAGPVVVYGHGLLGSRREVLGIGGVGATAGIGFCALDYLGMSTSDVPVVIETLAELSGFRTQADRLQQGHLAFLVLGRLLASDAGFATDPAFQDAAGGPAFSAERISFLGASQGGILGGPASALTDDWTQTVFAVGGIGYNLLLERSSNWPQFAEVFDVAYPDAIDQIIAIELIEMLWDRGENAGWAQHLTTDTYDGAPEKNVMLLQAFADHQVANVSTEKLARTLGVPRRAPTLAAGRSADVEPFFAIPAIESYPHAGSGLVVWDFGTPPPPLGIREPTEGDDPHGKLSDVPEALVLLATFIEPDGPIIDVCGAAACQTLE